jgi:hypothetical protein
LRDIDNPTNAQIKNAKREYWKLWYRHYRRKRRKIHKEYTLSFDTDYLQEIYKKKGVLSTSEFLYKSIDAFIKNKEYKFLDESILKRIHHNQMELINQLEELLEIKSSTLNETVLQKIETLESLFLSLSKKV